MGSSMFHYPSKYVFMMNPTVVWSYSCFQYNVFCNVISAAFCGRAVVLTVVDVRTRSRLWEMPSAQTLAGFLYATLLMMDVLLLATLSQTCEIGKYGANCRLFCSSQCNRADNSQDTFCSRSDGECFLGCKNGHRGPGCNEADGNSTSANTRTIFVCIVIGVAVGCCLSLIAAFCVRKQSPRSKSDSDE